MGQIITLILILLVINTFAYYNKIKDGITNFIKDIIIIITYIISWIIMAIMFVRRMFKK